jgi:NhaP-type Na+/H+ or K+/H+ antiporter
MLREALMSLHAPNIVVFVIAECLAVMGILAVVAAAL